MNFAPIDHRVMRCTIGQWNCMAGTVALFPGSTVPSAASVEAARKAGGAGANMLLPGRYEHEKGIHKSG